MSVMTHLLQRKPLRPFSMKTAHVLFITLLLLGWVSTAHSQNTRPEAMSSSQDILKAVSQARGKVVVLNFWASWCGPCRQEIPELVELRKRVGEDRLVILGVSVDQDPAAYSLFTSKAGFNYPVSRAQQDVFMAFSIRAIPRTMVYSKKGELMHTQEGYMPGADLERMVKKLLGA